MDIKRGQLSDYFDGVGVKRLSAVDAEPKTSNQHEIGVTKDMREQFLGETKTVFPATYIWLGGDQDGFTADGTATYYDARENQYHRAAEWRLYYPPNPVTETMSAGDTLFLAKQKDGTLYFIVAAAGSTSESQLEWLFGLAPNDGRFVSREVMTDGGEELDFGARFILDELGIEFEEPEADKLDTIIERFGLIFPKTVIFSDLARQTLPAINAAEDPDFALMAWLDHEEAMFRRLERRIVGERLHEGFAGEDGADVDGFLKFSLGVQNRRKSRMGHSLENHLEAVFRATALPYQRGAVTEHGHRPDFLFPNLAAYSAAAIPSNSVMMLGAKSSCKDRWRQVLSEAEKIPRKHLLTLEPGISKQQTDQMESMSLQLVIPEQIHGSYASDQKSWLWSLAAFIDAVRSNLAAPANIS
ncbi:restriction endonuclease [Pacificimonas sp. WHA3]|uniref:Restriction endonuclease n=1 Tax=Pacificimonas pallii TaxID=2827236 RepID=A0ABS6SHN9_9SPHN|nr:type II restriction endonuclease [Pacificimonas pallii]MBV7257905.1 restriction endonuclease [Pacificimonas pallii]